MEKIETKSTQSSETESDYIARTTYMERKESQEPTQKKMVVELQNETASKPYEQLATEHFSEDEFLELLKNSDKETKINIAKNPNITKKVALNLLNSVYLVHINLWNNPSIDDEIKEGLKDVFKRVPSVYGEVSKQKEKE